MIGLTVRISTPKSCFPAIPEIRLTRPSPRNASRCREGSRPGLIHDFGCVDPIGEKHHRDSPNRELNVCQYYHITIIAGPSRLGALLDLAGENSHKKIQDVGDTRHGCLQRREKYFCLSGCSVPPYLLESTSNLKPKHAC